MRHDQGAVSFVLGVVLVEGRKTICGPARRLSRRRQKGGGGVPRRASVTGEWPCPVAARGAVTRVSREASCPADLGAERACEASPAADSRARLRSRSGLALVCGVCRRPHPVRADDRLPDKRATECRLMLQMVVIRSLCGVHYGHKITNLPSPP